MTRRLRAVQLMVASGLCFPVASAFASQDAPPAPIPAPAQPAEPANPNSAVVVAVQGSVQVQLAENGPWLPAEVGQVVPPGGAFRTGLRSAVQVRIGAAQLLTIDRMGKVTLEDAVNASGVDKTQVGLDYGRVLFNVSKAAFANDVQIVAPDATLAVRGTTGAMEVALGFPTAAFGLPDNTGAFSVEYVDGSEVTVVQQGKTDSDNIDPADQLQDSTLVDSGDPDAREDDELAASERGTGRTNIGNFDLVQGLSEIDGNPGIDLIEDDDTPGGGTPGGGGGLPPGFRLVDLLQVDHVADSRRLRLQAVPADRILANLPAPDASLSTGAIDDGLAAIGSGSAGLQIYYMLGGFIGDTAQTRAFNELYRIDVDSSGNVGAPVFIQRFAAGSPGSGSAEGVLTGLAALGPSANQLYAVRQSGAHSAGAPASSQLISLNVGSGQLEAVMDFTIGLDGAIAAAPSRGSVFVVSQSSVPGAGSAARRFNVLEFDPRPGALYLKRVIGGDAGPNLGLTSILGSGVSQSVINNIFAYSGAAFVGGRLVLTGRSTDDQGNPVPVFVTINPDAAGTSSSPAIARADLAPTDLTALGELTTVATAASTRLLPAGGPIDTVTINSLFARMAYSSQSLPFVQRVFTDHFLTTARDPAACAVSSVAALIPSTLRANVGRVDGIGRTAFELRNPGGTPLDPTHPCAPGTMMPGGSMPAGSGSPSPPQG